ncbi:NAF1-domain-containing protein [Rickenella mellea]|uniref:H/ACA ribonucleoprotein complex non-core subunit NAF1 n=1 Tax=Rickenella mellea TaxID=50990 RepID=A0A4Y7Q0Z2_9AGAM|nr:NAF1-domain-containing protein [Rickenella mellea]
MFKIPSTIPQDLLLIHGLVDKPVKTEENLETELSRNLTAVDDISSSESDSDDEVEIEAELVVKEHGTGTNTPNPEISFESDSDSSSSSDSDPEEELIPRSSIVRDVLELDDGEDDEAVGSVVTSSAQVRTQNELPDPAMAVVVPDIIEVDPDEILERVGEIMSIVGNSVIVKGLPSQIVDRGNERALDTDSLLVFEDRKVLGYVYETFGPTHQPMYHIKFCSEFPLDPEIVQTLRPVFHVPSRSKFVFPSQLKKLRGSDASNVHDEEVGDHELEFSDDEAEAAHKREEKRRRGSREPSIASSRSSTPIPSQMRDQDMTEESMYGASPYDDNYLYDMDTGPSPSRPSPTPYDDPYAAEPPPMMSERPSPPRTGPSLDTTVKDEPREYDRGRTRGRGRGRGRGKDNGRGRGRERAHGRGRGGGFAAHGQQHESRPRTLSPTSMAIARATGQYNDGSDYNSSQQFQSPMASPASPNGWTYPQYPTHYDGMQHESYNAPYQQPYIQPHINPRFASLFGMNMNFAQNSQSYQSYGGHHVSNHVWNQGDGHERNQAQITPRGGGSGAQEFAVPLRDEEYVP